MQNAQFSASKIFFFFFFFFFELSKPCERNQFGTPDSPPQHSLITEPSMDAKFLSAITRVSFVFFFYFFLFFFCTYLKRADNNLCRCPALAIKRRCTYPLWCATEKNAFKDKRGEAEGEGEVILLHLMERSQNAPLLTRSGVRSICAQVWGGEVLSGAARWCPPLHRKPEAFVMRVAREIVYEDRAAVQHLHRCCVAPCKTLNLHKLVKTTRGTSWTAGCAPHRFE